MLTGSDLSGITTKAERGDVDCQFLLAVHYLTDSVAGPQPQVAYGWARKASQGGHKDAKELLAKSGAWQTQGIEPTRKQTWVAPALLAIAGLGTIMLLLWLLSPISLSIPINVDRKQKVHDSTDAPPRSPLAQSSQSGSIRAVDFRNLTYSSDCFNSGHDVRRPSLIAIQNGSRTLDTTEFGLVGGTTQKGSLISYGDLLGSGREQAAVITYCGYVGSTEPEEEIRIFDLRNGSVAQIATVVPPNPRDLWGWGITNLHISGGLLTVRYDAEGSHVSPGNEHTATYQWNGSTLAQVQTNTLPKTEVPQDPTIEETLDRWAAALAQNDVSTEIRFYGPEVDPYFRKHHVSRQFIEADKKTLFDRGVRLTSYQVRDLFITMNSPDEAIVLLTKEWQTQEGAEYARTTRSRLHMKRLNQDWKIVGEQDLRAEQPDRGPT